MKKAIVFGAAGIGIKAKYLLEKSGIQVMAFLDNDSLKWGDELEGIPILNPSKINVEEYDFFAIGLYKSAEVIKQQYLKMGVSEDKIVVPVTPDYIFYNDKYVNSVQSFTKYLILIWGGIDSCSIDVKKHLPDCNWKRLNFGNHFWGFQYFIDDCLRTSQRYKHENFWDIYSITTYASLCIDICEVNCDFLMEQTINELSTKQQKYFFCSNDYSLFQTVYNKNTLDFWKNRLPRSFETELEDSLSELKYKLKEYNIPMEDICIVSGAVMQTYGIRSPQKFDDVDIIMTNRFRKMYGSGLVIVSEHIEMHPENEFEISDDEIIMNPENHYWFRGIKFMNLELLYQQKRNSNCIDEVKLLDYYFSIND